MRDAILWLTIFCAAALLWQLYKLFLGLKSHSWPATLALIKSVSIDGRDQGDGDIAYYVAVEYSYRVGGKNYTSNRLTYSESTQLSRESALELTTGLKTGLETNAFYDPAQPAIAVLRKGVNRSSLVQTAIFGAVTAACLIVNIRGSA